MHPEFERWVRQGLGRAVLSLRRVEDPAAYREVVMAACFSHPEIRSCIRGPEYAIDLILASERSQYVLDLIDASREFGFYRDGVLNAVRNPEAGICLAQLFYLAGRMASRQDAEMKDALYGVAEQHLFVNENLSLATQYVFLDGVNGLRFALSKFGRIEEGARQWPLSWLTGKLVEWHEDQEFPEEVERWRPPLVDRPKNRPRSYVRYDEFMRSLPFENDRDRLLEGLAYLRSGYRQYVGQPIEWLLDIARGNDFVLAGAAIGVLENIPDRRARQLGIELLSHDSLWVYSPGFFRNMPEEGDFELFERLLCRPGAGEDHRMISAVVSRCEDALPSLATGCLLRVYEVCSSGLSRRKVIAQLMGLGLFTEEMHEECRYDSSTQIRRLVS